MPFEREPLRIKGRWSGVQRVGLLRQVLAVALGAVLLLAVLVFSLLVFAVVVALALLIGGYVWWKTRALRHELHARDKREAVIEGDAARESERAAHRE